MRRTPSLDQLRAFVAVAEYRSLTGAAERIGIATATMSLKIKGLEQTLENTLFKRTPRGTVLTNAGEALLFAAREVLESNRNLIDLSSALARKCDEGHLEISCPDDFGKRYLAPIIALFIERHPRVTVNLALGNERHKLLESPFDIVLRGYRRFPDQPIEDSNVPMRLVAYREMILCATPSYLARRGEPSHPDDLVDHECILFDPAARSAANGKDAVIWTFRRKEAHIGTPVKGRLSANSFDAIREFTLAGSGIGLLCLDTVRAPLERGELRAVLPDFCPPPVLVYMTLGAGRKPELCRHFGEFLVERLHAYYGLQAPGAGESSAAAQMIEAAHAC